MYGDSLMSGYGLDEKFLLSTILEKNLKMRGFDVTLINASVSGDTTSGGLNRLSWLLEEKDVDILVLCLGANDMLRGIRPNLIKQNLNKILELLLEKKITILLAGMKSQETFGQQYKKDFDDIYPDLAKEFNITYLPFLLEGVALNPKLNLQDGHEITDIDLIDENRILFTIKNNDKIYALIYDIKKSNVVKIDKAYD